MKLLKPDWTRHDGKPIFSIDVHPDGSKFATGGQGVDSGRVVIWNMKPVLTEEAELDKNCPKILCQLDQHLACVNCVRWSGNGEMLASGGDDKVVMVWKKGKGPSAVFGNTGITKVAESWRCQVTLRGHEGDVLDLAWSPQDRWLSTCSVDNTIMVWDMSAGNLGVRVAWLRGHTGLVKGVTWDPVGKFMASQSDDRSVKIWKTADWTCQASVTDPFDECGGTTHILRLSWSPDGLYLVSAHAMNGGGPTAQIIEREGFKCDKDFVGHRKAVTCVRFHNSILRRQAPTTNKWQQYCCLAIGSRDHSLSVWMTALQRPLVVVHGLFQDSILDLSWSTDNHILLACSTDGTVACLQFSPDELGTPLSIEHKNALYQRMYGQSTDVDLNVTQDKTIVLEYAELLNESIPNSNGLASVEVDANIQNNNLDVLKSIEIAAVARPMTPGKSAISKQFETRSKDGRRRITPMFIPLEVDAMDHTPVLGSSSPLMDAKIAVQAADARVNAIFENPSVNIPVEKPQPAKSADMNANLDNRLAKLVPPSKTKLNPPETAQPVKPADTASATPTFARTVELTGRSIGAKGKHTKTTTKYKIEATNASTTSPFGQLSKLTATNPARQLVWEIFFGSPVVRFSVSEKFVLSCSTDGTLRFIDIHSGAQFMPVLKMPSVAIQCCFSANSEMAGVVCENGGVRIWRLNEQNVFLNTTCSDILSTGPLANFHITDGGVVFILLANGSSYTYSRQLESWIVVNSRDPIVRIGVTSFAQNLGKNIREFPLNTVQALSQNFPVASRSYQDRSNSNWEQAAKLSFVENQIQICLSIDSPVELEHWYGILGQHLAEHGTEPKIRQLFDEMLGVSVVPTSHVLPNKCSTISKHQLLRRLLAGIKSTPRWQRIYVEYLEQLNEPDAMFTKELISKSDPMEL